MSKSQRPASKIGGGGEPASNAGGDGLGDGVGGGVGMGVGEGVGDGGGACASASTMVHANASATAENKSLRLILPRGCEDQTDAATRATR
jgi:hypothetical protein